MSLRQTIWKIPLTFLGMLAGASVGREGPSVQVRRGRDAGLEPAVRAPGVPVRGFQSQELIAAGAAGEYGLMAAFNAPLAGAVFAIEELGRAVAALAATGADRRAGGGLPGGGAGRQQSVLRPVRGRGPRQRSMAGWMLLCGLVNGVLGGVFARPLGTGLSARAARVRRGLAPLSAADRGLPGPGAGLPGTGHPPGAVYGTGYESAAEHALRPGRARRRLRRRPS